MKLIFLDIDGVLNTIEWLDKFQHPDDRPPTGEENLQRDRLQTRFPKENSNEWLFRLRMIDPAKVRMVADMVKKTGAKIVISSSWRKVVTPEQFDALLAEHGMPEGTVIGETLHSLSSDKFSRDQPRGHYIHEYLQRCGHDVTHFVVLDDDARMGMVVHRYVRTYLEHGLTDDHVRRALLHLGYSP